MTSKGMVHIPVTLVPHQEAVPGKAVDGCRPWRATGYSCGRAARSKTRSRWPLSSRRTTATADGKSACDRHSRASQRRHRSVARLRFTSTPSGHTHFHLSRFDGIHVLALDGDFQPDGSLKGQLAGVASSTPFTAKRSKDVASADPNAQAGSLTRVKDPQQPFRFGGVDQSGKAVDQASAQFKGKAVIVDIFGTWCPNCHDEAPILEELYRKYHSQGLEIVGLAYEYTDDNARNLRQIGIYRAKYGITFPAAAGRHHGRRTDRKDPAAVGEFRRLSDHDFSRSRWTSPCHSRGVCRSVYRRQISGGSAANGPADAGDPRSPQLRHSRRPGSII